MAEVLLPDVTMLVGHMSCNGTTYANTIHYKRTAGGAGLTDDSAVANFRDFLRWNTPDTGFLESISGYATYQRKIGEVNVEHPPFFTNEYHLAGEQLEHYVGSAPTLFLPKDVVVFCKLATSGGRSGKMFLRNLVYENDVGSVQSGIWEFDSSMGNFTTGRFDTVVAGTLADCMPGGSDFATEQFVVCHLLLVKSTDTRAPFATNLASVTAVKPTWNKAHR